MSKRTESFSPHGQPLRTASPTSKIPNEFTSLPVAYPFTVCCCAHSAIPKRKIFPTVEKLLQYTNFLLSKPVEEVPVIWIDVDTKSIHLRRRAWEELTKCSTAATEGSITGKPKEDQRKDIGKTWERSNGGGGSWGAAAFSRTSSSPDPLPEASGFISSPSSFFSLSHPPVLAITLSESDMYEIIDPCDADVLELVGPAAGSSDSVLADRLPCIRGVITCTPDPEPRKCSASLFSHSGAGGGGGRESSSLAGTSWGERGVEWEETGSLSGEKYTMGEVEKSVSSIISQVKREDTDHPDVYRGGLPYENGEERDRHGEEEEEEERKRRSDSRMLRSGSVTGGSVPWCSFVASRRVLLTFHAMTFAAIRVMEQSLSALSLATATNTTVRHHHKDGGGGRARSEEGVDSIRQDETHQREARRRFSPLLPSTASLLSKLICTSSEARVVDPTALLSEVDCIDEMVLLIAPGDQDQPDLLRRVALLRRRISEDRSTLYMKEKLLHSFMAPSVRIAIASSSEEDCRMAEEVRKALKIITQVADRLDDARDTLNQANLNFVTGVSMRISQSSSNMDFKMQVLSQVAVICLPLNLVASIFGMNCTIPFMTDNYPSLTTFWVIISLMVLWCAICSIPSIRSMMRGNQHKAIVSTE